MEKAMETAIERLLKREIKPEEAVAKLHEILTLLGEYSLLQKYDINDMNRGSFNLLMQATGLEEFRKAIQCSVDHFTVNEEGHVFVSEGFDAKVKVHLDLEEDLDASSS